MKQDDEEHLRVENDKETQKTASEKKIQKKKRKGTVRICNTALL
jgi:hypothetical protein